MRCDNVAKIAVNADKPRKFEALNRKSWLPRDHGTDLHIPSRLTWL